MRACFLISIFSLLAAGCTKDFHIDEGQTRSLYVIEGRISNLRGPYYVRITKTSSKLQPETPGYTDLDNATAVEGAQVMMADDMGMTDTLKPMDPMAVRYTYAYRNGKLDSSFNGAYPWPSGSRGYYGTNKMAGIPGHTYHLKVRIGNETFEASAYMPYGPALDSAALQKDPMADSTGQAGGDVALVYFSEPRDEDNYYLLQATAIDDYPYDVVGLEPWITRSSFPFYIFDDRTLPSYVNGMRAQAIFSYDLENGRVGYRPILLVPGQSAQLRLQSLTRETYEYFKTLEKQFLDDGNVYKPTPASAKGNISGGALGLFWATQVSYKLVLR
jgi:hypothetical protein